MSQSAPQSQPAPQSAPAPEPEPAALSNASNGRLSHADWLAGFEALGLGGLTRNLAAGCVVEEDDGERLRLRLDPTLSAMRAEIHIERMQQALAAHGVPRRLVVEEGEIPSSLETPRQQAERLAAQRHAAAVEALGSDPHVPVSYTHLTLPTKRIV